MNMRMRTNRRAFTLVELMIVVLLVGIIGSFALHSYSKAIDHQSARNAVQNLRVLHAYCKLQKSKGTPVLSTTNWGNLNSFNTALGTQISDTDHTYTRTAGVISIAHTNGAYTYSTAISTEAGDLPLNITCVGTCPVVP